MLESLLRMARSELRRPQSAVRPDPRPFNAEWVGGHLGDWVTAPPSAMHLDDYATLEHFHVTRGQRIARQAPRGSAKSTNYSKAYPLWAALEGVEPFTLLLSDTESQAAGFLADIKRKIEADDTIRGAYPTASGVGPEWKGDSIVLRNGCRITARGSGGRIRGLTHNGRRPTLVVIDDANKREDAYSPTMRARTLDWVRRDVMPVGEAGYTNFICVGTPIHREAVICEVGRDPTWQTVTYQAIRRYPDRMDLWHEWENRLANLGDPDRLATAERFYKANRGEMEAGAVLLWPERFPLSFLMRERASIGQSAFDSEYQDKPGTAGATEWPSEYFDRADLWFDEWPDDLAGKAYYLDPSKGTGSKAGDWQGHVWGGWSRGEKCFYVEADLRREPPTAMIGRAIDTAVRFGCGVTAETNATMGLLVAEFERQVGSRPVALQGIHNAENKEMRMISTLGPWLARGQVRIRNTGGGRELVSQLRDVPNGEYDDGVDALAGAIKRMVVNINGGR